MISRAGFLFYFLFFTTIFSKRVVKIEQVDFQPVEPQLNNSNIQINSRRLLAVSKKSHKVTGLPGLSKDISFDHYAGHILVDSQKNSNLFYWLFESSKNANDKPLLIWLNGGPGCSSMDGLWLELGPLRLSSDKKQVKINQYSWHNAANLLFIDQPVGTGLAFTKSKDGYARNDQTVNEHFYNFLMQFYAIHTQYVFLDKATNQRRTRTLYFSGESHAGHYIPSMVVFILEKNSNLPTDGLYIDVQGIALGNPWIDPPNQYNPAEFAHGLGLLSNGQLNAMKETERKCRNQLTQGKLNNNLCYSMLDSVVDATSLPGSEKVLFYDVRQFVPSSSVFPPGHENLESYLNRPDVRTAIHATNGQKFEECADPPYYALAHQDGKGVVDELVTVLEKNIQVLIFAGQHDMICNHLNLERVLDKLPWSGREEWLKTQPGIWMEGKKPLGYIREHKNLQSLTVLGAGHMVPMDLPQESLSMITNFLTKRGFKNGVSKLKVSKADLIWSDSCRVFENQADLWNNTMMKRKQKRMSIQRKLPSSSDTVLSPLSPCSPEQSSCCVDVDVHYLHPRVMNTGWTAELEQSLKYLFQQDLRYSIFQGLNTTQEIGYSVHFISSNSNVSISEEQSAIIVPIRLSFCETGPIIGTILARMQAELLVNGGDESVSLFRAGVISGKLQLGVLEVILQDDVSQRRRKLDHPAMRSAQLRPSSDSTSSNKQTIIFFLIFCFLVLIGYFYINIRHVIRSFRYH